MQRKLSYPELVEFYNALAMDQQPPPPPPPPSSSSSSSSQSGRPKAPRRSPQPSPRRRALQQRSDSQVNVTSAPTIRLVAESGPEVYSKSPFPTLPSHVLLPSNAPGPDLPNRDARVSEGSASANASAMVPPDEPVVKLMHPHPSVRASISTVTSEPETIAGSSLVTPSSSHFSHSVSPPSTPPDDSDFLEHKLPALPEESTPDVDVSKSTIRTVIPSSPNEPRSLTNKRSETSITTSTSSDTITSSRREASSPNYYVFQPAPLAGESSTSPALKRKRDFSNLKKPPPKPYESVESIAFSDASYSSVSDNPKPASGKAAAPNAAIRAAIESGVKIQYPVINPPSASGSWAESSFIPPSTKTSPSMTDSGARTPQWSNRLSTIASESERNSQSLDGSARRSGSHNHGNGNGNNGRRRTISSFMSSEGSGVWTGSSDAGSIPMPPPLLIANRALPPLPRGRDSEEGRDILGALQSPPLRQQRSGFLPRMRSRPASSDSVNSQISFVGDLSWARNYYRQGEQRSPYNLVAGSESRLNTSTSGDTSNSPTSDAFTPHIFRPRNRPFNISKRRASTTDSERTNGAVRRGGTAGSSRRYSPRIIRPMRSFQDSLRDIWSPHLTRDRRSNVVHYGAWHAPSFDEPFWTRFFGPVNRQVWLFCFGFVLPLAWILGAVLPLPRRPHTVNGAGPQVVVVNGGLDRVYLQNTSVFNIAEIDERRYQKARWWRILNRIMVAPALLIMGAVIALAIIATRLH